MVYNTFKSKLLIFNFGMLNGFEQFSKLTEAQEVFGNIKDYLIRLNYGLER